ncbi:NusB antitermination factor [Hydrogenivirga caldilitoris]|uniref:Transcription antitermination protein NusB n=1 Tax=Hydrogenivirga caldilitoris TaxID=246264 RepID=A0A497XPF1_9AQUI|nr:transcription antitermination factor NusB [Hydrogenivirga caldilitoris]RLJ70174.1 NusB antitermination factor [Hydrogenivirga caldilitoris]
MRFRKKARENGLIVLYRWDIRGDSIEKVLEEYLEEKGIKNDEVIDYTKKLLSTVKDRLTQIDSLISEYSEGWSLDRLGYIERNALRLGVAELLYMNPPDPGRAFNDYIDLVKRYADGKAAKFVNGILSGIYKDYKATSSAKRAG